MIPATQSDIFGREINVGDYVVYATYDRGSGLKYAKVLAFPTQMKKVQKWNSQTRVYDYSYEQQTKITLLIKTAVYDSAQRAYVDKTKKQTLDSPDRMCVVDFVPQEYYLD